MNVERPAGDQGPARSLATAKTSSTRLLSPTLELKSAAAKARPHSAKSSVTAATPVTRSFRRSSSARENRPRQGRRAAQNSVTTTLTPSSGPRSKVFPLNRATLPIVSTAGLGSVAFANLRAMLDHDPV